MIAEAETQHDDDERDDEPAAGSSKAMCLCTLPDFGLNFKEC